MKKRAFYTGWIMAVLFFIIMMFPVISADAAGETPMGIRAAYENRIGIGADGTNPASGAFFNGHISDPPGPNTLIRSAFGQPFGTIAIDPDTELHNAQELMYGEPDGAFAYKKYLYEKAEGTETALRARIDADFANYWTDAHRDKAAQAKNILINALTHMSYHRGLRWALLDIYYETAVAEMQFAKEKRVKAYQSSLGILGGDVQRIPGEFLISTEIAQYEGDNGILALYEKAMRGYLELLNRSFPVDISEYDLNAPDVPFGYYLFRKEVPVRSLMSPLKKEGGNWVLPSTPDAEGEILFTGYKDMVLLFRIQKEYLSAVAELVRLYALRSAPATADEASDAKKAYELTGTSQQEAYLLGNLLLGIFPDWEKQVDEKAGMAAAVAGWRQAMTDVDNMYAYLEGDANFLGFPDDFLALIQSVIPGEPGTNAFHTYTILKNRLMNVEKTGFLDQALAAWDTAKTNYEDYRENSDELYEEIRHVNTLYEKRLYDIVGVFPGTPGYDTPEENEGSEIWQQIREIEKARLAIEKNGQEQANIDKEIEIETERLGKEKGVNEAIKEIRLDYGDKQEDLITAMTAINVTNKVLDNQAEATNAVMSNIETGIGIFAGAGYARNIYIQGGLEVTKGLIEWQMAKNKVLEECDIIDQTNKLLDINHKAWVKTRILEKGILAIESAELVISLLQNHGKLSALYCEKQDLEAKTAERMEDLADRYFADPAHRAEKNNAFLQAEMRFKEAQKWMFFTVRALEYKWNHEFNYACTQTTDQDCTFDYNAETLLMLRNANELLNMLNAMNDWDLSMSFARSDDQYKKFSLRQDFMGYRDGSRYADPVTGESVMPVDAFRSYLQQPSLYVDADDPENPMDVKALRFTFSTAFEPESGGFFLRNRWLEKINYLRIKVMGGTISGIESQVDGYMSYGGTSYIRDFNPTATGAMTPYSTRYWYFDPGLEKWLSKESFGSSISVEISEDPDVPPEALQINVFKEYSVAASEWNLYIAVETGSGTPLLDITDITDIELHFYFYFYSRGK